MPDTAETKWLKTLLFSYFSQIEDPQITDKHRYETGCNWISYGALVYAIMVALRGNDEYTFSFDRLQEAENYLSEKFAVPDSGVTCWAREWERHKTEMPWQVWEDGTFDFMESKASTVPNGWNWTDLSFRVSELHSIWPEANVFTMGEPVKLSELDKAQVTVTEAAFIIGIERSISINEINDAMWEGQTGGLSKPIEVDHAIERILDKALAGEIEVMGTPSNGLQSLTEPRRVGITETIPREAFGPHRTFSLSRNCLNANGGKSGHETEYSDLSVLVAKLKACFSDGISNASSANSGCVQHNQNERWINPAVRICLNFFNGHPQKDLLRMSDFENIVIKHMQFDDTFGSRKKDTLKEFLKDKNESLNGILSTRGAPPKKSKESVDYESNYSPPNN